MTEYLDLDDLLEIAREAIDGEVMVRDYGLLESASCAATRVGVRRRRLCRSASQGRGTAALFGAEPRAWWTETSDLRGQRAERSWQSTVSGSRAPEDERFDFVIRVATGMEPDLGKIAERLRQWSFQEN